MDEKNEKNEKIRKLLHLAEHNITLNYIVTLETLRNIIRRLYDNYENSDGKLTYREMNAYNRMRRMEKDTAISLNTLYRENDTVIKQALEDIAKETAAETAKKIKTTQKIKKIFDIDKTVNGDMAGLHWAERTKHHRDNVIYEINKTLKENLSQGATYKEMSDALKKRLNGDVLKPMRIIRTESARVYSVSKTEVLDKCARDGIKMTKTWHTAKDERVRNQHQDMDGKTIDYEEDFVFPDGTKTKAPCQSGAAHHDINCRCYITVDIKADDTHKNAEEEATKQEDNKPKEEKEEVVKQEYNEPKKNKATKEKEQEKEFVKSSDNEPKEEKTTKQADNEPKEPKKKKDSSEEEPKEKTATIKNTVKSDIAKGKEKKSIDKGIEKAYNKNEEPKLGYKEFTQTEDFLNEEYDIWKDKLTFLEKEKIKDYTDTHYIRINNTLRTGRLGTYDNWAEKDHINFIESLDKSLSKFELKEDISVIRGLSTKNIEDYGYNLDKIIGQTFKDKGYLSASIDKGVASDFAERAVENDGGEPLYIQFDIPKGTGRGAFIDVMSSNRGEEEFLIVRNVEFEFYEKTVDDKNNYILLKARWEK